MATSKDEVISILKACVVSSKGGLLLPLVEKDYKALAGSPIPFKKLGYTNLEKFLESVPEFMIERDKCGFKTLQIRRTLSNQHLLELVSRQKSRPSKSRAKASGVKNFFAYIPHRVGNNRNINFSPRLQHAEPLPKSVSNLNEFKQPTQATPPKCMKPVDQCKKPSPIRFPSPEVNTNANLPATSKAKLNFNFNESNQAKKSSPIRFPSPEVNANANLPATSKAKSNFNLNESDQGRKPSPIRFPSPEVNVNANLPATSKAKSNFNLNESDQGKKLSPIRFPSPEVNANDKLTANFKIKLNFNSTDESEYRKVQYTKTTYQENPTKTLPNKPTALQGSKQCMTPPARQKNVSGSVQQTSPYVTKLNHYCKLHNLDVPCFYVITIKSAVGMSRKKMEQRFMCRIKVGDVCVTEPMMREPTAEAARQRAAKLMLDKLMMCRQNSSSEDAPITENSKVAMQQIKKVLQKHASGLFESALPGEYQEMFGEKLPEGWFSHFVECNDEYEVIRVRADKILIQLNMEVQLPHLVYPDSDSWCLHVTNVVNVKETWVRIIDDGYRDKLQILASEMKRHKFEFGLKRTHPGRYVVVVFYNSYHRAQILSWQEGKSSVQCKLIDLGIEAEISLSDIAVLPDKFAKLPGQAFKCSLKGLELFESDTALKLIVQELNNQIFTATYEFNEDGEITLELFEESNNTENNINEWLVRELVDTLKPSLPEGMDVCHMQVSFVTDTCSVFVQPQPGVVKWIESQLANLSSTAMNKQVSITDYSTIYLLECSEHNTSHTTHSERMRTKYFRVIVKSVSNNQETGKQMADVFCLDYGDTLSVAIDKLIAFPDNLKAIAELPSQALCCKLRGVPPQIGMIVTERTVARLLELLPKSGMVVVRTSKRGSYFENPQIELISRKQPENIVWSINDTIAMDNSLFEKGSAVLGLRTSY